MEVRWKLVIKITPRTMYVLHDRRGGAEQQSVTNKRSSLGGATISESVSRIIWPLHARMVPLDVKLYRQILLNYDQAYR
jgi:hypothetical protein